jgi:hypothetical protein
MKPFDNILPESIMLSDNVMLLNNFWLRYLMSANIMLFDNFMSSDNMSTFFSFSWNTEDRGTDSTKA